MWVLQYLHGYSERELCDEMLMHAGFRWFCGLSFNDNGLALPFDQITNNTLQSACDMIVSLVVLEERRRGRLAPFEGIRIVRAHGEQT